MLANLFGTPRRVALGMGATEVVNELREVGQLLARLEGAGAARGLKDTGRFVQQMAMGGVGRSPVVRSPACQEVVLEGAEVDLGQLPVQTCWPGDVGP